MRMQLFGKNMSVCIKMCEQGLRTVLANLKFITALAQLNNQTYPKFLTMVLMPGGRLENTDKCKNSHTRGR